MSGLTHAKFHAASAPNWDTEELERRGELLVVDATDADAPAVLSGNGLAHLLDSKQALPSQPPRVFLSDRPPGASQETAMAVLNPAPRAYFEDTSDEDATCVLPPRDEPPSAILALDDPATTIAKRRRPVSPGVPSRHASQAADRTLVANTDTSSGISSSALDVPDFRRGIYRAPAIVLTTLAAGSIALILISL